MFIGVHHDDESFLGFPPNPALLGEISSHQLFGILLDVVVLAVPCYLLVLRFEPFGFAVANIVGHHYSALVLGVCPEHV